MPRRRANRLLRLADDLLEPVEELAGEHLGRGIDQTRAELCELARDLRIDIVGELRAVAIRLEPHLRAARIARHAARARARDRVAVGRIEVGELHLPIEARLHRPDLGRHRGLELGVGDLLEALAAGDGLTQDVGVVERPPDLLRGALILFSPVSFMGLEPPEVAASRADGRTSLAPCHGWAAPLPPACHLGYCARRPGDQDPFAVMLEPTLRDGEHARKKVIVEHIARRRRLPQAGPSSSTMTRVAKRAASARSCNAASMTNRPLGLGGQQLHDGKLMGGVQRRRRLVGQQQRRLDRESTGQQDPRALAARQLRDGAVGEVPSHRLPPMRGRSRRRRRPTGARCWRRAASARSRPRRAP